MGDADIGGAFNDGAAVGEHCQLIIPAGEAEREFVGAHHAEAFEVPGKFGKIEWAAAFVNLHGVTAA